MAPSTRTLRTAFPQLTEGEIAQIRGAIRLAEDAPFFDHVKLRDLALSTADAVLGAHGVEYIPRGRNSKSPPILYCNTGDTYGTTILYVNRRFRVGSWGDIVEKGNYE